MTRKRTANQSAMGSLSKNSAGAKHYAPEKIEFATPTRITNASVSKGAYSQVEAHKNSAQRPGCMAAYSLPSRGAGC
jgi:hypothetical protein